MEVKKIKRSQIKVSKYNIRKDFKLIEKLSFTKEQEAKAIVYHAFRNCPTLEGIHSGKHEKIPAGISRITEAEMKEIMKFAVDQIHYFLWLKEKYLAAYNTLVLIGSKNTSEWDKPKDPSEILQEWNDRRK
jgi:hypothetical protein